MRAPTTDELKSSSTFRLSDYIAWCEDKILTGEWTNQGGANWLHEVAGIVGEDITNYKFPADTMHLSPSAIRGALFKTCKWRHSVEKYPDLIDLPANLEEMYSKILDREGLIRVDLDNESETKSPRSLSALASAHDAWGQF